MPTFIRQNMQLTDQQRIKNLRIAIERVHVGKSFISSERITNWLYLRFRGNICFKLWGFGIKIKLTCCAFLACFTSIQFCCSVTDLLIFTSLMTFKKFCWILSTYHPIERAIARLKIFQILSFIRHDLYPYINKIIAILAYTGCCLSEGIPHSSFMSLVPHNLQVLNFEYLF